MTRTTATPNLNTDVYTRRGEALDLVTVAGVTPDPTGPRLGQLFEAHHQRLYRLARRMTPTVDDARDLVQDTFVRAARSPRAVPSGMPAEEAWLVRVLVNLCRDRWRRRAVQRRFQELQVLDPAAQSVGPDAEAALIAQTTIWRALRQLAPRRRAVIVLRGWTARTSQPIARLLGVAATTVRWHLSRGRRELAAILQKKED